MDAILGSVWAIETESLRQGSAHCHLPIFAQAVVDMMAVAILTTVTKSNCKKPIPWTQAIQSRFRGW